MFIFRLKINNGIIEGISPYALFIDKFILGMGGSSGELSEELVT